VEMDPVDRITAEAVGPPGERSFYIQARQGATLVTVLVEKQQVQLLSSSILEILARVGKETAPGPGDEEMELEEPLDPLWRAGRLSIGYQEERDLLLLEIEEFIPDDDDEDGDEDDDEEELAGAAGEPEHEADRLRLWATREQMLSLSRHGALVCSRGRPTCQFCGNPMDPEGHVCPAMNGHGELA
jgi:uncharacterized repeat protein (TIGR03847 family)